jgi:phenylalanyl-tRNA synthetase alpha chain
MLLLIVFWYDRNEIMDTKSIAQQLSEIERNTLTALQDGSIKSAEEINRESSMNIDSVRRSFSWLSEKGLVEIEEQKENKIELTTAGTGAVENGLPETRMLKTLEEGNLSFEELQKKTGLNQQEFSVALGTNKKNAFIVIIPQENTKVIELTEVAKEMAGENQLQKSLEKIHNNQPVKENVLNELKKRGLVEEKETILRKATITNLGKQVLPVLESVGERAFDVTAPVPPLVAGKKQPYIQFLNHIRRKLVSIGFKEMPERLITQEFYNFDVLFQPQNHPARTWTDSYQLKNPKQGMLTNKKAVNAIKQAHENGGKTGSTGWGYKWDPEIARRLIPTAHGTTADARQMVEGTADEQKYFVINRCFRPDVLDATHLIEFNQVDGFVVGKNLNFRSLLYILKQFAMEIGGARDVKFFPDYYPFTEPSVQMSALHPQLGWVEFGGAGVLRPEITEPLGIQEPGIAWGLGIDRLAMFKLGIKDIRKLFSDDLEWLRNTEMVME